MKLGLIKCAVLLAIAIAVVVLYLRAGRAPVQAEISTGSALKAHASPMPTDQHEEEMLTAALKKNPGHTPVLLKLAEIESGNGHLQDAAGHLREILKSEPGSMEANLELGRVLFELGDIQGAIEHTEEILKSHPMHEDALYNMGAIYANIGNRKRAKIFWNRLAGLHPGSPSAQKAQLMLTRLETSNP